MLRTFFDFDNRLRSLKNLDGSFQNFKRFNSLSELPFDFLQIPIDHSLDSMIEHYKGMITRQLTSKFAVPTLSQSDYGMLVNIDASFEGIAECYLHTRPVKSVLKIGLNVSGDVKTEQDIFAMRCAAIIAIWQLAKSRGQKVQFDVCYGRYGFGRYLAGHTQGHSRITITSPTLTLIKKVCHAQMRDLMCAHVNERTNESYLNLSGGYQLHAFQNDRQCKSWPREFDFCLDRLETDDKEIEYKRILSQIEHLR